MGIQDNRFVKQALDSKLGNRWRNRVTRLNAEDRACFKEAKAALKYHELDELTLSMCGRITLTEKLHPQAADNST